MDGFTGRQLRAGLAYTGLTAADLAARAGIARKTLGRWMARPGEVTGHRRTLDAVRDAFRREGCDLPEIGAPRPPVVVVPLPAERLDRLDDRFSNVRALGEIARETRVHECVVHRLRQATDRITSVYEKDGELLFGAIGGFNPFVQPGQRGGRLVDIPDREVSRSAAERNWRALITGDPVFSFVHLGSVNYTILTVPTRRAGSNRFSQAVSTAIRGIPNLSG